MPVRAEQKEKRRNEILEAGLELFIHRGYANTKITDIAKHVGMSSGLLFHYFESKEKLYEELIKMGLNGPTSILKFNVSEPLMFFEKAVESILNEIKTSSFSAKMFVLMNQALSNDVAPLSIKELLSQMDIVEQSAFIIQAGQQDGTIREGNPQALSIVFWVAITGIAQYASINPDIPLPEAHWIIDLIRRKDS